MSRETRRSLLRRGTALAASGGLVALAGCTGPAVEGTVQVDTDAYAVVDRTDWWAGSFIGRAAIHVIEGRLRTAADGPVAPPAVAASYFGPDGTALGRATATLYGPNGRPYATATNPLPASFDPGSVHRFKLTFQPDGPLSRYRVRVA